MKNLRVSKNMKSLALAGIIFVGSNAFYHHTEGIEKSYYNYDKNYLKVYTSMLKSGINKASISDYCDYLVANDLVPVKYANRCIDDMSIGNGCYAQKKIDKSNDGTIDKGYWQLARKEDLYKFTGLVRVSDDISYRVYDVNYVDNEFIKNEHVVDDLNSSSNYFVDLNDVIVFSNYEEVYCYEGRIDSSMCKTRKQIW